MIRWTNFLSSRPLTIDSEAELHGHNSYSYKQSLPPLPSILTPYPSNLVYAFMFAYSVHVFTNSAPFKSILFSSYLYFLCSLYLSLSAFANLSITHYSYLYLCPNSLTILSLLVYLRERERFFFCFFMLIIQMSFV